MVDYLYLITLFPLLGFIINGIFGAKINNERFSGILGSSTVLLSFILTVQVFLYIISLPEDSRSITLSLFNWVNSGAIKIEISYLFDPLSVVMCLIITGIGFLIHVYSVGYMHGDKGYARFFAFLNLFIFAMLNLVLADNLLLMFLGWEGVGLCSYLLIGFYYQKKFTGDAANKAFWVNRIGDFGFMLAMFFIFYYFGSLNFNLIFSAIPNINLSTSVYTLIALLLFIGATGKSAQIPLYVWLPDAMAGPTPVSALIHAATMVTAGVYMIARMSIIYAMSPVAMDIVMITGAITAFIAATIALAQYDIKKILAYSTVSQLGFMFMAMGVGAFSTGIFHVTTHAFFKALMFLGAGSVIHGMHEEQDITKMGGLKTKMKITFVTFLLGGIAISGIPPFSGFFSKDEILAKLYFSGNYFTFVLALVTAFITAFYIFRLISLTFYGKPRYDINAIHPHESPSSMTVPLIILSVLSVIGGFIGMPHIIGPNYIEEFLNPVFSSSIKILPQLIIITSTEIILIIVSTFVAVISILLSWKMFKDGNRIDFISDKNAVFNLNIKSPEGKEETIFSSGLITLLRNKYYVDELYDYYIVSPFRRATEIFYRIFDVKVIDGMINNIAAFFTGISTDWRKLQTGIVQDYAVISVGGIFIIILYILLK